MTEGSRPSYVALTVLTAVLALGWLAAALVGGGLFQFVLAAGWLSLSGWWFWQYRQARQREGAV